MTAPEPRQATSEPPPAIEAPPQVHLRFHGVDAAEVAELVRRQQEDQR